MAKIIDIQTKKKWRGPKSRQGAAQEKEAKACAGGETRFEPIGDIAERVVRQLRTR